MNELVALSILLTATLLFAALSRRIEMSVVTMPIVFTALGYLALLAGTEFFPEGSEFEILHLLAEMTLVVVLFYDASRVKYSHLRKIGGIPARMLLIGMPLSILAGTLVARWVSPDQPWALALLVAAILTPTDAALGQAVVSDPAMPEDMREAVSVESGLNDGLVLPIVIMAALAAVEAQGSGMAAGMSGSEQPDNLIVFGLSQITLGPLAGIVVGVATAAIFNLAVRREYITDTYRSIYFLSCAFLCFVVAELIGGNGLIAAFVGGLAFGKVRHDTCHIVTEFMEGEGQLLTMVTFLIFGLVMVPAGLEHATWQTLVLALAFLTVVRIVPVVLSLTGTRLEWKERLFLGWFGPRGLASILYALLVMQTFDLPGADEAIACVVLTVLVSIVAHGVSAYPIVRAYASEPSKDQN